MSEFKNELTYISKQDRELSDIAAEKKKLNLNPWTVQNIVYELVQNHLLTNDPKEMGFTFGQKYDTQKEKSQIDLEIAFNWKPDTASKRPAIFISRGSAAISYNTIGGTIGSNSPESQTYKSALISLPVSVMVVANPVGFVEQLADYIKYPLMYWSQIIQCDFGFTKFRLTSIGKPQIYVEAKDNFIIELALQIEYRDNWVIQGDDLKLKTFSAMIFDSVIKKPLENQ